MPRFSPHGLFSRRMRAFTLVEIMVVVVIIGLLAAAGIPSYRRITMRSKVTTIANDLKQFSTVIQAYTLQNGHWPADGTPQIVPTEMAGSMPGNFELTSPFGGVYKWNYDVSADGVTAKAALIVQTAPGNPISDDEELLTMLDKQMDDGDLTTGLIQTGSTNSLVYIIEK